MNLSPNFTLREFTQSATAMARGWENVPPPELMPVLRRTAAGLELVRELLARQANIQIPMIITSGYRSRLLNQAVGSKDSSQHVKGEAVDFVSPHFGTPAVIVQVLMKSDIPYDQLISESTAGGSRWVHISFTDKPRRQALEINANGVREIGG
jgi:hypothetical protein